MSLTLTDDYKYTAKSSAINEIWYAKLYYDAAGSSDFLGISSEDIVIGGVTYYGIVNDWGEITDSINLAESSASISDMTIECTNVLKNGLLSDEIFGTSTRYINRKVEIYSFLSNTSLQLYTGRLVGASFDYSGITLNIEGYRPWAGIMIPQTISGGVYEPLAYGDYDADISANYYIGKSYYPMPFRRRFNNNLYYIAGQSLSSGAEGYFYDSALDKFLALSNTPSTTSLYDGVYLTYVPTDMERTAVLRASNYNSGDFSNPEYAYDENSDGSANTTTYAYRTQAVTTDSTIYDRYLRIDEINEPVGVITGLTAAAGVYLEITDDGGGEVGYYDNIYSIAYPVGITSTLGVHDITYSINVYSYYQSAGNQLPTEWETYGEWSTGLSETVEGNIKVYYSKLTATIKNDLTNDKAASEAANAGVKYLYCGADGLDKSYSGGSGTAQLPHEILRDLLARFTDFDYVDGSWDNWSSLNTARSGWNCRWWALEPISLESVLKQIQYEGCFIFKQNNTGDGAKLIWVENTAASAAYTFDENDYNFIDIGLTDINEIITKTTYNYQRHPAKNSYIETTTYTNTTDRSNWVVGTNENHTEKNLDFIAADKVNTGTNPNDCVALYYDNILSEPKILVEIDMINPAKIAVETGDIIKFDDTNIQPFGKDWADIYFMVTSIKRSPGVVSVTAREVYEI